MSLHIVVLLVLVSSAYPTAQHCHISAPHASMQKTAAYR